MKSAHPEDAVTSPGEFSVMLSGSSIELKALALRLEGAGAILLPVPEDTTLDGGAPPPQLLVCDLASPGSLLAVERFYGASVPELQPHLIALGSPRGEISEAHAALLGRARHRFRRPLDIQAITEQVLATLRQPRPSARAPQSQGDLIFSPLKARSSRAPRLSVPTPTLAAPASDPAPGLELAVPEEPAHSRHLQSPALEHSVVSPELESLLAEAERRVQAQMSPNKEPLRSMPPNGAGARLSDEMWDALAEPLDDDVDNPFHEAASEDGPPPSPLQSGMAERSLTPPGDSTIPPHLWENPVEEETGAHTPLPESEQTSGSLGPLTAAGSSAAPPTLGPGGMRTSAGKAVEHSGRERPEPEGPETLTPEPPSTTPPGARTRASDTRPPKWAAPTAQAGRTTPPRSPDTRAHEDERGTLSPTAGSSAPVRAEEAPASPHRLELPGALVRGAPALVIGRAVRQRFSGCLAFEVDQGLRRIVFKDGDVVIAASAVHGESLVSFLVQRGDLALETAAQIEHRIPVFGRHAGAALIARGLLEQGELWPVLRSHAEWVLCQLLLIERGSVQIEAPVPERLATEPAVFGGATGAEVLVEVIARAVPPAQAIAYLGSGSATMVKSGAIGLLSECALSPRMAELVKRAESVELGELLLQTADEPMLPCVLHALSVLDVIKVKELPRRPVTSAPRLQKAEPPDAIDDEAVRGKIRARRALVEEGDYFALLGVPRQATGYDIRRSYLELRRQFEPGLLLRPNTLDLQSDVDTIIEVLDEAYEILRDQQRRERYRRAIESSP